jgi:signal peptidase I
MNTPPPVPVPGRPLRFRRRIIQLALGILLIPAIAVPALRSVKMILPMRVPTNSMSPNVNAGEHVFIESVSLLWAQPKRGNIVAFNLQT